MSWDLALSSAGDVVFTPGDVVFSPSADIQGISGIDLIEQRIRTRLKVQRGSWTYDEDGSFGSQLYRLTSMVPQAAIPQAVAYVREALREMPDIDVDDVDVSMRGSVLIVIVNYHVLEVSLASDEVTQQNLEIVVASPSGGV